MPQEFVFLFWREVVFEIAEDMQEGVRLSRAAGRTLQYFLEKTFVLGNRRLFWPGDEGAHFSEEFLIVSHEKIFMVRMKLDEIPDFSRCDHSAEAGECRFLNEDVIVTRHGATRKMAPRVGLEPTTCRLTAGRSTN